MTSMSEMVSFQRFAAAERIALGEAFGAPDAGAGRFRADMRYGRSIFAGRTSRPVADEPVPKPEAPAPDPEALAFEEGFAAGHRQAEIEAEAERAADDAARGGLALALGRIDKRMEEELGLRLRETVAALCEAAVAPLALDPDMLARRVERAAAMLARADDERVIRLHPQDIRLVAASLRDEWTVEADASLERGTVRVEGLTGGVEDGPATWRQAIAEALHKC
jgi:flagellar assembly protein FliH